jgi:polysaccharide biosynthesis transport protein
LDSEDTSGLNLREYAAIVWRHKWLIIVIAVVATVGAYYYANSKTPLYRATTELMYVPPIDTSTTLVNQASDTVYMSLQVQSVPNVIAAPEVEQAAAIALGPTRATYSVSAEVIASDAATGSNYTNLVEIAAVSTDPRVAARAANAYRDAFIDWRKKYEVESIAKALAAIETQISAFKTPESQTSTDYSVLVNRRTDLQLRSATATGDFVVLVPASPPRVPFSPKPVRSAMLGLGVGLILGLGLAFLRAQFDTSVRSHREVSEILSLPILGRIPRITPATLKSGPLVALTDSDGAAAEAVRVLRSNLEFFSLDERVRSLLIVSAQKGEGKSLTVANLAITLAMAGKSVVLIDGDLRRPRLHQAFDMRNEVGLSTVLSGQSTLAEALQPYTFPGLASVGGNGSQPAPEVFGQPGSPRLFILTSGAVPPNPGEMMASRRFETLLEEVHGSPIDYVLVDSPAFLSVGDAAAIAAKVDGLVLVVNIERTSRPELEDTREFLAPLPCRKLGVVAVSEKFTGGDYYHRHA